MSTQQTSHRAGLLKQSNKTHKHGRHRSKSEIDKNNKGRVQVKAAPRRKNRELKREERRRKADQLRSKKREQVIAKKRALGGTDTAPFLTAVIPLGQSANIASFLKHLKNCDEEAKVEVTSRGILHINLPRFRQHHTFVTPIPGDLYASLDACKVADSVLFLLSPDVNIAADGMSVSEFGSGFDEFGEIILTAVMSQGLPSPLFVLNEIETLPLKKRSDYKKMMQKQLERICPLEKLYVVEKEGDVLRLLHQLGSQKQRPVFQRDLRSHILSEELSFKQNPDDVTLGTLTVEGYVRYQPLNVNGLVHIPGWGDFQMERMEVRSDKEGFTLLEEADPEQQETLKAENDPDPLTGEQTWPYQEEMDGGMEQDVPESDQQEPKKKLVPKGTSDYQAAWIKDDAENDDNDDNDDDDEDEDDDDDDDQYEDMESEDESDEEPLGQDEDDAEDMESVTVNETDDAQNYDKKVSFADDQEELRKLKEAREDEMFPDEVDTPRDTLAKVRFQKYRGLQSFRTSPWDPKENLPWDYSRIFQFENFQRTRKRIVNEEKCGGQTGWYVRVYVKNVPSHLAAGLSSHYPLVLVGMLPHEQRMSVVNLLLKRSTISRDQQPIPSKERLIFHCGFRRFAACPIFSQHTAANKHKAERFFRPESAVVATMYAPIIFPPASVLVFREKKDGSTVLVACGSVHSINPDRVVIKRAVLSGHAFKVHRKSAVVRFMFFNREDIDWFKPVELRTKYGRRGHIREPLGTHGHMKCIFDGPIKSQDTVLMNLYKRVFPKWTYDPSVAAPLPLYDHGSAMEETTSELMV